MKRQLNAEGFTIIEILVVVVIIGILASIVVVSFNSTLRKSRDAKRLADMQEITKALDTYFIENNQYPGTTASYGESETPCGGWDTSTVDNDGDGKPFIEPLLDGHYLKTTPQDPIGTGTCGGFTYRYYRYNAGSYGCSSVKGNYYVVGVNDLESSGNPHPQSSGWGCNMNYTVPAGKLSTTCISGTYFVDCRNWQTEFDWVTGGFEKE